MNHREITTRTPLAIDPRNRQAPAARLPQKEIRGVDLRAWLGQSSRN